MLQLMRDGASSPAVAMATVQHMALSSNTGWDFNMASDCRAGYSHQPILFHPHISSSASVQNAQNFHSMALGGSSNPLSPAQGCEEALAGSLGDARLAAGR